MINSRRMKDCPNGAATPAPRHAQALPGITAPRHASFNEADVSDKPGWLHDAPLLTEAEGILTRDEAALVDFLQRRDAGFVLAVGARVLTANGSVARVARVPAVSSASSSGWAWNETTVTGMSSTLAPHP